MPYMTICATWASMSLQVVNLRLGGFAAPEDEPFEEPLSALAELKQQGLVQHIGLSTVSPRQLAEAQAITEIVCIQNLYNVAQRGDDQFIGDLAAQGIAYVPYFPLGGFSPLQSAALDAAAASLPATPMQLALAWLLQRARNVLLIPGTSSIGRLHEVLRPHTGDSTGDHRRTGPDAAPPGAQRKGGQHAGRTPRPGHRGQLRNRSQVAKELVANGVTVLVGARTGSEVLTGRLASSATVPAPNNTEATKR